MKARRSGLSFEAIRLPLLAYMVERRMEKGGNPNEGNLTGCMAIQPAQTFSHPPNGHDGPESDQGCSSFECYASLVALGGAIGAALQGEGNK